MRTNCVGGRVSLILLVGACGLALAAAVLWALYGATFAMESVWVSGIAALLRKLLLGFGCASAAGAIALFAAWAVDFCRRRRAAASAEREGDYATLL